MPRSWTCNLQNVRYQFWCWIQAHTTRTSEPLCYSAFPINRTIVQRKLYQPLFLWRTKESQHCPLWRRCMAHVLMLRPQQVSPQCRTILHAATSLQVLSTFKEIRDIFSGGKEGLLPEVWQEFTGCVCHHVLWGKWDRLSCWQASSPCPLLGHMDNPRNPTQQLLHQLSKCRDLSNDCSDIFLAGSDLWISLISLTHTVNINQLGLRARTQKIALKWQEMFKTVSMAWPLLTFQHVILF